MTLDLKETGIAHCLRQVMESLHSFRRAFIVTLLPPARAAFQRSSAQLAASSSTFRIGHGCSSVDGSEPGAHPCENSGSRSPAPGRQPRAAPSNSPQVPAILAKGAEAFGLGGQVWTTGRVAAVWQVAGESPMGRPSTVHKSSRIFSSEAQPNASTRSACLATLLISIHKRRSGICSCWLSV